MITPLSPEIIARVRAGAGFDCAHNQGSFKWRVAASGRARDVSLTRTRENQQIQLASRRLRDHMTQKWRIKPGNCASSALPTLNLLTFSVSVTIRSIDGRLNSLIFLRPSR